MTKLSSLVVDLLACAMPVLLAAPADSGGKEVDQGKLLIPAKGDALASVKAYVLEQSFAAEFRSRVRAVGALSGGI